MKCFFVLRWFFSRHGCDDENHIFAMAMRRDCDAIVKGMTSIWWKLPPPPPPGVSLRWGYLVAFHQKRCRFQKTRCHTTFLAFVLVTEICSQDSSGHVCALWKILISSTRYSWSYEGMINSFLTGGGGWHTKKRVWLEPGCKSNRVVTVETVWQVSMIPNQMTHFLWGKVKKSLPAHAKAKKH